MKGDFHVRFCEKFEVKFLLLTRLRCALLTEYSAASTFNFKVRAAVGLGNGQEKNRGVGRGVFSPATLTILSWISYHFGEV